MTMEGTPRTLDWTPRWDDRSLMYRMAATASHLPSVTKVWDAGPVLDQGSEGACVGFGCAGEAAAEPVAVPGVTDAYARRWYHRAQKLDEWPGEGYTGTSVLAGLLDGRAQGLYDGFTWATSVEELAYGIVDGGPAIIGVQWRQGMYEAPDGLLTLSGEVVGGHCLVVLGYVFEDNGYSPGRAGFILRNSWGPDYGTGGNAFISVDDMRTLCAAGWEAAQPVGRKLPAKTKRRAATEPTTAAKASDRTLHVRADELATGDRITDGLVMYGGSVTLHGMKARRVGAVALLELDTTGGTFRVAPGVPLTVRRPLGS